MPTSPLPKPGDIIRDRYRIEKEIARGGMGVVYKIFERNLQRNLAMKVLSLDVAPESQEDIKRTHDYFLEEALLTAQLEHPNIVPVHDIGELANGNMFFTMKMVQGESLEKLLDKAQLRQDAYDTKYPLMKRLLIFRKICDAVAFAHSRHIIHRDIKPENIMVGEYGEVLLMDWGLAKYLGRPEAPVKKAATVFSLRSRQDFARTIVGDIWGTPLYISPEQLSGDSSQIDRLSDIYLLGGTLYHLLTFLAPHTGNTMEEVADCSTSGKIIPPQTRSPGQHIPTELQLIVMKALALKKEDRYPQVEDLAADLDAFMAGDIAAEPVKFKKGERVIRQGDEGNEAYFIINGQLDVFQDRDGLLVHLASVAAGDVVGEMAIISAQKRMANVVATQDTEVLIIDRKRVTEVLQKLPMWLEKILLNLVNRLRVADQNTHPLMQGDCTYHVLQEFISQVLFMAASLVKTEKLEDKIFKLDATCKQIAYTLCIPLAKVAPVMERLATSRVCQVVDADMFKVKDMALLCYVLYFVHKAREIELTFPFTNLPPASNENKILAQEISAVLLNAVSSSTADRPFTFRKKLKDFLKI